MNLKDTIAITGVFNGYDVLNERLTRVSIDASTFCFYDKIS